MLADGAKALEPLGELPMSSEAQPGLDLRRKDESACETAEGLVHGASDKQLTPEANEAAAEGSGNGPPGELLALAVEAAAAATPPKKAGSKRGGAAQAKRGDGAAQDWGPADGVLVGVDAPVDVESESRDPAWDGDAVPAVCSLITGC
jgi:hypothetical protein